jgi:hypothetical protein
MAFNGITADGLAQRALELVGDIGGAADAA